MSPVEEIRQAAALIRERAEAKHVPSGPWKTTECHPNSQAETRALGTHSVVYADGVIHAYVKGFSDERKPIAAHIASWSPPAALAVADLLESMAAQIDERDAFDRAYGDTPDEAMLAARARDDKHALALARAYLGEQREGGHG